jgi:predicted phosphoadenosine phosphosulfate sulfurtransferase
MSRVYPKRYVDVDVLTAARRRFDLLLSRYDDHFVSFSGGKDSLATLHLLKEAYDRSSITRKVKVSFLDEELIPDSVVDFVDEYRKKDWIELYWFVYPLESNKYVLGKVSSYVQWDPNREHVRTPPAWGLTPDRGQKGPFSQYGMNLEMLRRSAARGRVAGLTGMRADESMNRYCANASKLVDNWISHSELAQLDSCNPIYDWSENDVMKFLGQEGIRYCPHYDAELYSRTPLRVSTPIHTGSAKRIGQWRKMDPDFYERVTRIFPEMLVQERYYASLSNENEPTIEALEEWIRANVAPSKLEQAMTVFSGMARRLEDGDLEPEDWPRIWRHFTAGSWLKMGGTFKPKKRCHA